MFIKVNIPWVNSLKSSQEGSAIKSTLRSPVGLSGEFFWYIGKNCKWVNEGLFQSPVSGSMLMHKHMCFNYGVIVRCYLYLSST